MELETRAGAVCLLYSTSRKLTSRALSRQHVWSWNGNFHASNACFRRRSKREIMERDCSTSISIFRSPSIFIWKGGGMWKVRNATSLYMSLNWDRRVFIRCHLLVTLSAAKMESASPLTQTSHWPVGRGSAGMLYALGMSH